ncbi:adenosine deaminase, partial [Acinetobacter baumannii]
MQAPQPAITSHIPQNFSQNHSGKMIAEKSYKEFISDPKLLQVIEISLNNNRDLRTATLNIERVQQEYQITKNSQLPTIGVTGNAVRQVSPSINPNNPVSTFQVGLGMTAYELDF